MVTSHLVRRIITFLLLFILWIPSLPVVLAADNPPSEANQFATSYDVAFDIGEDGITTVTEKVSLRNLTSQYYATEFKLIIGATQISEVKASDPSGPLDVKEEQTGTSTTITVKFNQQVAGKDKILPWTLQYKSKDFATKEGKIWEISAPKVSSTTNLENYNLTLSVPVSFGDPSLISPNPKTQTTNSNKRFLTFDKSQLINAGVSANFGINQLFDFDLTYNLENNGLAPILTNIALPPDTAFQDVVFQRIDPQPLNVTVDNDGNFLAWYKLNRNQKFSVKVVGSAKLYTNTKVKKPNLDPKLRGVYTANDKYWEKDNPIIKTKLSEILGANPPAGNREKARLIHRYVVGALKYDTSRLNSSSIERLGAVTALNNPSSAVCMEFTDLFIALARAAGIPARELDGFAYTSNSSLRPLSLDKDILHAWPEYWDDTKGWVMIDPTWENTTGGVDYFDKLDLNHFTFAIKGISSEQPIPAGSYKYLGQDSHDVKVTLSETDFTEKPQLDVNINSESNITAGFPGKIKVKITNLGNGIQPSVNFSIFSDNLNILKQDIPKTGPIPAFGYAQFEFDYRSKSLLDSFDGVIKVSVGDQNFTKDFKIRPFVLFNSFPIILIAAVFVILAIYLSVLGGFAYRKRVLKNKLPVIKVEAKPVKIKNNKL